MCAGAKGAVIFVLLFCFVLHGVVRLVCKLKGKYSKSWLCEDCGYGRIPLSYVMVYIMGGHPIGYFSVLGTSAVDLDMDIRC